TAPTGAVADPPPGVGSELLNAESRSQTVRSVNFTQSPNQHHEISRSPDTSRPRLTTPAIEPAPTRIRSIASRLTSTASISLPGSRLPMESARSSEYAAFSVAAVNAS